jgi:CNT family concentrative nucleoside transporter
MALLHGLLGMAALIGIAVLFSLDRRGIDIRTTIAALLLQIAIAATILFVPWGRRALHAVSLLVNDVLNYGNDGIGFLFGDLVGPRMTTLFPSRGFIFALRVLPEIIYISALIAVLYHLGIMQMLARIVGGALRAGLRTSVIEAFSAVTAIFLGQSEMPIAIRPFVPLLTHAELLAVMSSGTASVAGSVLAGYAGLGVSLDYLLAASFMAIPGGLLFAKLLLPSSEPSRVTTLRLDFEAHRAANLFEAVAIGTGNGVRVAVAVGSMLIAFIGMIACLNGLVGRAGGLFGAHGLSLQQILGWVFAPLTWLTGVPWQASVRIGGIIGQKIVFNEFVAYVQLSPMLHAHSLDEHSLAIASFALCGFANLSSVGILLASFGAVAPERRSEVSRLGLRAVLAGTLSNLMSATIAGIFIA